MAGAGLIILLTKFPDRTGYRWVQILCLMLPMALDLQISKKPQCGDRSDLTDQVTRKCSLKYDNSIPFCSLSGAQPAFRDGPPVPFAPCVVKCPSGFWAWLFATQTAALFQPALGMLVLQHASIIHLFPSIDCWLNGNGFCFHLKRSRLRTNMKHRCWQRVSPVFLYLCFLTTIGCCLLFLFRLINKLILQ